MAEPNTKVDYQDFDQDTTEFLKKLKRVFADINIRMAAVESLKSGTADFERRYGTVALERIDAAIAPVLVSIQAELANAQAQLASILAGTAPDADRMGGELPAFYLDPANFDVSADIAALLAAGDAPAARTALGIAGMIDAAIDALVAGAPGALDTVNELAAALGDDPNFATTVLAALADKADAAATTAALATKPTLVGGVIQNADLPARLRETCQIIADWNSIASNGWFMAQGATNAPNGTASWVYGRAIAHNSTYVELNVTIFTGVDVGQTWRRRRSGGGWAAWERLYWTADEQKSFAIGWGQTWQNVTGSRAASTTYQNTTGRPIMVVLKASGAANAAYLQVSADGSSWDDLARFGSGYHNAAEGVIPNNYYYRTNGTGYAAWMELR